MIGHIRGLLIGKQPPYLLVETQGIGYEILAPLTTFEKLPAINQEIQLYTHLVVREDAHTLYGFYTERDRHLFRALIKINGIGPKLALTILSGIAPLEFARCIKNQDIIQLTGISGIGRKTAERLVIEMKETVEDILEKETLTSPLTENNQHTHDAISALIALGYKPKDAKQAIMQLQEPHHTGEELIRLALKSKAQKH